MLALHVVSIILEVVIAIIAILIATQKKASYGWGIALTFAIYVFYDIAKFIRMNITMNILFATFFIATLSMLWAVWSIYKSLDKK